ncbi:MAG: hypothetical protein EOP49_02950, partial [Sphingobacteriales bacterium]
MKQFYFLMLAFLIGTQLHAQSDVTIATGTSVGNKLPVAPYFNFSFSEQIYLKSEIAVSGSIAKLRFYKNANAITNSSNWTIYMGHTTKTSFTGSDWIAASSMTQVYSGTISSTTTAGWVEISLTTPFFYNNVDNLVVAVDENGAGFDSGSSTNYFRFNTTTGNKGVYYHNDSVNPDPANLSVTGTPTAYVPQIQLAFQSSTPCTTPTAQPTALTFGTVTTTSVAGSFTAASPAPSKYLVVRSTTNTAPTLTNGTAFATTGTYTVVQSSAATAFSDSGLTAGTNYYYFIYSYNDGCSEAPSYLTTSPLTGTKATLCSAPTSVTVAPLASAGPRVSWVGTGNFIVEYGASGFTPGTGATAGTGGTIVSAATSPFTITGLAPGTTYAVYVRQSCPLGGTSANSSVATFTTPCAAITTFPSTQDFTTFMPSCWTGGDNGNLTNGPATYGSSVSSWTSDSWLNGSGSTGAAKINIDLASDNDWLISPSYTITAGTGLVFDVAAMQWNSVNALSTPWEADDYVELVYSTNGITWTTLRTYNAGNVPSYLGQTENVDLSSLIGQTVIFAFHGVEGSSDGSADIDFMIDNFAIATPCAAPSAQPTLLTFGTTTTTTISGSFTAASPAPSKYAVIRGTTATAPVVTNGTTFATGGGYTLIQNSAATTFSDSGLTAGTNYYYFIYSYNDLCAGAPVYLSANPLTGMKPTNCSAATALTYSNVGITGATVSWTGAGNYIVEYGVTGFTPGTTATAGAAGTIASLNATATYTITGLAANTTYQVYVRQACPLGGFSANSSATSFKTLCAASTAIPVLEPFATALPACWTLQKNGSLTTGPTITAGTAWVADGWLNSGTTGAVRAQISTTGKNDWLISPTYVISTGLKLSYNVAALQSGTTAAPTTAWENDDFVEVAYSENGTSWTLLKTYSSTNVPSNLGVLESIPLTALEGLTVRFAFRVVEGATDGAASIDFMIDNFALASCAPPTALVVGSVATTTATASWTAPSGTTPSQYEYELRTSGAVGSGATGFVSTGTVTSPTLNLSTLTPATAYTLYVRSNCGPGDSSTWINAAFTTACASNAVPYTIDFESTTGSSLPLCTSTVAVTGNPWITTAITSNGFSSRVASYPYAISAAANSWFFTAAVNLTAGTIYRLSYKYGNNSTSYTEKMKIAYGASASVAGMTTQLFDHTAIVGGTPSVNEIYFVPAATGVYYFGFNAYSDANQFNLYLDDIAVTVGPSCVPPTNVNVNGISATGATINWTAPVGTPVSYNYEVRTSGAAGSGATGLSASGLVNAPATSAIVTGLSSATTYYVYLKTTCSAASTWTAPVMFTTLCNPTVTLPFSESFESVALPVCWSTQVVAGNTWASVDTNTSVTGGNTGARFMGLDPATVVNNSYVVSPQFNLSSYGTLERRMSVWVYRGATAAVADEINFLINGSASTTGATTLGTIPLRFSLAPAVASAGWYNYTYIIPAAYNSTPFYILVKGANALSTNNNTRGLAFDDFRVELTPPTISGFTPATICSNDLLTTTVLISGSHLDQITSVTLNGQSLTFTPVSASSIQVNLLADSQQGSFIVTGPNGSATSASQIIITTSPTVEPITGENTVCQDASTTLVTQSSAGTWSSSNTTVATVLGGVVTGHAAGTAIISYTVVVNGCTSAATKTVTVNSKIASTDPLTENALLGTPVSFSVTASNANTFQWQISSDAETFTDLAPSAIFQNVSGAVPSNGIVTLNITEATEDINFMYFRVILTGNASCSDYVSGAAQLKVGQTGIVSGTPAPVTLCRPGTATFTVQTTGSVDFYNWYVDKNNTEGPVAIDSVADGLGYDVSVPGTLVVSGITTANNGWIFFAEVGSVQFESSVFASATLTVNDPVVLTTGSEPVTENVCGGVTGTKTFSIAATGTNLSYQWLYSPTGAPGSFVNLASVAVPGVSYSGGASDQLTVNYTSATPNGSYYYHAVVTGAAGCSPVTSATATLTINLPVVSVNPASAIYCDPGTPIQLTASGATTYVWSPATGLSASTGASVTANPSVTTTYTVTGTGAGGCTATSSVTITVGGVVSATASANLPSVCSGAPVQLNAAGAQSFTTGAISSYGFTAASAPYTPVGAGATALPAVLADDAVTATMQ